MLYHIENILTENEAKEVLQEIMSSDGWKDGIKSANYGGELVKKNLQLNPVLAPISKEIIENRIYNNVAICNRCFTNKVHNMMFSRTGNEMFYGQHTDKPNTRLGRRDISFTLFLNESTQFEGGELILYINPETKSVKLSPGQAIFYPTKYIHEVNPVKAGERVACVGWIESDIEEHDEREILTNLQQAVASLQRYDRSSANVLSQAYNRIYKKFMG